MNLRVVCVGNIKEKFFADAINEYLKRISRFHKIEIIETKEGNKNKTVDEIKVIECEEIKKYLKGYIISLDLKGEQITSVVFSEKIDKIAQNNSTITFVIGGSNGLDKEILNMSNHILSFSKMTFPHQLFRVMLLEQIYRASTISNNVTYHK